MWRLEYLVCDGAKALGDEKLTADAAAGALLDPHHVRQEDDP